MTLKCIFLTLLLFCLTKSQTTERREEVSKGDQQINRVNERTNREDQEINRIVRIQSHVVHLLQQYQVTEEIPDLSQFMDAPLFAHTNELTNIIRGWATSEQEANVWMIWTRSFLHLLVLNYVSTYIQSRSNYYMSYSSSRTALFNQMSLLNNKIRNFHSQYQTNFYSLRNYVSNILRYELFNFNHLPIGVVESNKKPWFQLHLRHYAQNRFFGQSAHSSVRPLDPRHNYWREMTLLTNAQNILIQWNVQMLSTGCVTLMLLPHVDVRLIRNLEDSITTTMRHFNGRAALQGQTTTQFAQLINIILLNEFYNFIKGEHERHRCHPAHLHYYSDSDQLVIQIRQNNLRLVRDMERLNEMSRNLRQNNPLLSAAYRSLLIQSYRVGYGFTNGAYTLLMGYACSMSFQNPSITLTTTFTTQSMTTTESNEIN